jgi:hypothetical protein
MVGQRTHSTKIGADSLAENTPYAPEFICSICPPKPKSSGFQWIKASFGVRSPYSQSLVKKIKAIVELGLFLDLLINSCEFSMDCMRR